METYFTVEGMIHGYHVYKDVWNSNIGEMLPCTIERSNRYDPNAIAVMKGGTVVGHLQRKISFISKLFLELEGSAIECEVISGRRFSQDLPQGELEIPSLLHFWGSISKCKGCAKKAEKLVKLALNCTF